MIPHNLITRPLPLRDPEPVKPIRFDTGIAVFRPNGVVEPEPLPHSSVLPASTASTSSRLAVFLAQPNINDSLLKQLFPEEIDPAQTTPGLFTESLNTALAELTASENKDDGTMSRAQQVLRQQTDLIRLLEIYRSALYQG